MKKKILILGGGIGGLSAAHELAEGDRLPYFDIELVEAAATFGGKARSVRVAGTPPGARDYPGEHGFRFFPAFYRHIVDTMDRIPSSSGHARTIEEHLVSTPKRMLARYDKRPITMPSAMDPSNVFDILRFLVQLLGVASEIPPLEQLFFARRLWQIVTSSKARRIAQYEKVSWWDFVGAEHRSEAYQHYLARGLTHTLVAASPHEINAKTGGDVLVRMMIDTAMPRGGAAADRVLDGPTSEVWLDPWVSHLQSKGVQLHPHTAVVSLRGAAGRVSGVEVERRDGTREVLHADYYIAALPVECMAQVLARSPEVEAWGGLEAIRNRLQADVRWMTGLQLYLSDALAGIGQRMGHGIYVDSEWALTSISQAQFWRGRFNDFTQWGNGDVKAVLSCIISRWDNTYTGADGVARTARDSNRRQIEAAMIEQLARSLNGDGVVRFDPTSVVASYLDAALTPADPATGTPAANKEPLFVNRPKSWRDRPEPATPIPNLMIASDYARTNADLATMEGANEAARRAVNAILDAENVNASRCLTWELYYPEVLAESTPKMADWISEDDKRLNQNLEWVAPAD